MPDRIRGVPAVTEYVLEGLITRRGLVLFKGADQPIKRLDRNIAAEYRVFEGDEYGMRGFATIHSLEFASPPGEQAQAFLRIADLIAKIVGPAAEGIHVIEVLMERLGKQETDNVKVFVVMRRKPARVVERFSARIGSRIERNCSDIFFGLQAGDHGTMAVLI